MRIRLLLTASMSSEECSPDGDDTISTRYLSKSTLHNVFPCRENSHWDIFGEPNPAFKPTVLMGSPSLPLVFFLSKPYRITSSASEASCVMTRQMLSAESSSGRQCCFSRVLAVSLVVGGVGSYFLIIRFKFGNIAHAQVQIGQGVEHSN